MNELICGPNWSRHRDKELLELYLDGMDFALLANHFDETPRTVVAELSRLILDCAAPSSDPSAPHYGKPWNQLELGFLWKAHALGHSIPKIAARLGRDELGVCFRILSEQMVVLPRSVVEDFGLDDESFACEMTLPPEANVPTLCSCCLDVVLYCKCQPHRPF